VSEPGISLRLTWARKEFRGRSEMASNSTLRGLPPTYTDDRRFRLSGLGRESPGVSLADHPADWAGAAKVVRLDPVQTFGNDQ
jgi:hypothetical protein